MNSLKIFAPKIGFKEIDQKFLSSYEKYMLVKRKSISTVGIYLRALRAIFNDAIGDEVISRENYYPFGKRKYKIPASRNIKKALSLDELKKIFEYKNYSSVAEEKAVGFWKFSYLCNGMNMKDIAFLKFKNIDGEFIKFKREKTKETSRCDAKTISVFVSEPVKEIITKWGNKNRNSDNHIFPIINGADTEIQKRKDIQQFIKQVNKHVNDVTKELKFGKRVTTYAQQHEQKNSILKGICSGKSILSTFIVTPFN